MPLDAKRQLLVVGTMGSGTTATATGLAALGLEVKHESSDTLAERARGAQLVWLSLFDARSRVAVRCCTALDRAAYAPAR